MQTSVLVKQLLQLIDKYGDRDILLKIVDLTEGTYTIENIDGCYFSDLSEELSIEGNNKYILIVSEE